MLDTLRRAGVVAALGTLAITVAAVRAAAAERYVSPLGNDTGNGCLVAASPCRSIARAISQSASGDVINVAQGKYRENLRIDFSTTLSFLGGWDSRFLARDPAAHPTVIRSARVPTAPPGLPRRDRIWAVHAAQAGVDITVAIDGFTLMRGFATSQPPTPTDDPNDHWEDGGGLDATARGGSVRVSLSRSTITKNKAWSGGGGLSAHAFNGGTVAVVLDDVIITRNKPQGGGGAITLAGVNVVGQALSFVTLSATNCIIAGNRAHGAVRPDLNNDVLEGGGALWASSYSEGGAPGSVLTVGLVNSTLTDNRSDVVGGINVDADGGPGDAARLDLQNTILSGNHDQGGFGDLLMQTGTLLTVNADHTAIGTRSATGGIFNDLGGNLSVDAVLDRSYHLTAGSPLIDAGSCTVAPPTDVDDDPRPSGASCDIGADEFVP